MSLLKMLFGWFNRHSVVQKDESSDIDYWDLSECERLGASRLENAIKSWHAEREQEQIELATAYEKSPPSPVWINIWDELDELGRTNAYIVGNEVPDKVCFEMLLELRNHLISHNMHCASIRYNDDSVKYPLLLLRRISRYSLMRRWELAIHANNYEELEKIVAIARLFQLFQKTPVKIISES